MKRIFGLVVVLAVLLALTAGGWFAWIQLGDPTYRSQAKLDFAHSVRDVGFGDPLMDTLIVQPLPIERLIRNEAEIFQSDEFLRSVVHWPSVQNADWSDQFDGDIRAAAAALARQIDARPIPGTSLLEVSVNLPHPPDALTILDALITVYLQTKQFQVEGETASLLQTLMRERERGEQASQDVQRDRERFIRENDLAGESAPGPSLAWISERQLEASMRADTLKHRLGDLEEGSEQDQAALSEAKAEVARWQRAAQETHARHRDHYQKLATLDNIKAQIDSTRNRIDRAEDSLSVLRQWQSSQAATGVTRAVAPTEAQRVWWRWPWN